MEQVDGVKLCLRDPDNGEKIADAGNGGVGGVN